MCVIGVSCSIKLLLGLSVGFWPVKSVHRSECGVLAGQISTLLNWSLVSKIALLDSSLSD